MKADISVAVPNGMNRHSGSARIMFLALVLIPLQFIQVYSATTALPPTPSSSSLSGYTGSSDSSRSFVPGTVFYTETPLLRVPAFPKFLWEKVVFTIFFGPFHCHFYDQKETIIMVAHIDN